MVLNTLSFTKHVTILNLLKFRILLMVNEKIMFLSLQEIHDTLNLIGVLESSFFTPNCCLLFTYQVFADHNTHVSSYFLFLFWWGEVILLNFICCIHIFI